MSGDKFEKILKNIDSHLGRVTLSNLKKWKDDVHQVELSTDEMNTHDEVRLKSVRVAEALKSRGIGLGDIIVLCGEMHNDVCLPIIASFYIGCTVFPFSNTMTVVEVKRMMSLGNPKLIVCDPCMEEIFTKALNELKLNVEIVVFGDVQKRGNVTSFSDFLKPSGTEENFEVVDFDPRTTVLAIICSSGSTGLPKGVCLTHYFFASTIHLIAQPDYRFFGPGFFMTFTNFYWVSSMSILLLACLFNTPRLICRVPFTVELLNKGLTKYKPYTVFLSPMALYASMKHPIFEKLDFSSVKVAIMSGGPVSQDGIRAVKRKLTNGGVYILYASSEAGYITLLKEDKIASVGKIMPWVDWKVVHTDTGKEVKVGEHGELCIKSVALFERYLGNPEATKEAYDEDGFFKTGDLLKYDEEGFMYFVDRVKEVMKYRYYIVTPTEVEIEIRKLPDVLQVCVVGKKHEEDGERPVAFIQKKEGSKLSEEDVHNAVNSVLADQKKLRGGIVFLDKLPITCSGKVDRRLLKQMAQELK